MVVISGERFCCAKVFLITDSPSSAGSCVVGVVR